MSDLQIKFSNYIKLFENIRNLYVLLRRMHTRFLRVSYTTVVLFVANSSELEKIFCALYQS